MKIILVYDITNNKSNSIKKLCEKYLYRVQNSVFEGSLSVSTLKELEKKIEKLINKENDSILIYKVNNEKWLEKTVIGREKNEISNFI